MKTSPEDRAIYARWAKLATGLFGSGLIKVSVSVLCMRREWFLKVNLKPLVVENVGGLEDIQAALDRLKKGQNSEKQVATVA